MTSTFKITLLSIVLILTCTECSQNSTDDNSTSLIEIQLADNMALIDDIQNEMIGLKIDSIKGNLNLITKLENLHEENVIIQRKIDESNHATAAELTLNFIKEHFPEAFSAKRKWSLNGETSKSMLKLYLTMWEAFHIKESKSQYDFGDTNVRFDEIILQARLSKTVIKKGEKVTGDIVVTAEPDVESLVKVFTRVRINGKEIIPTKQGWKFEITPSVTGTGLVPYEFTCEAFLKGPGADTLRTTGVVYIQN